jgi:long-subunit acyl-CoA synthetase (AMP-forming)
MAGRPHQSGLLAWSTKAMRAGCRSATAARSAHRLAEGLQQLRLPPRSPVGLCMAGMAEAHLAFLAIEQAGGK